MRRMVRTVVAVVAVVIAPALVAYPASGQSAAGFKAGANIATLRGPEGVESVTGLAAGGYIGFGVGDRLALQIEAVYSVRGGDGLAIGADSLDDTASPARIELRYLEVPLLLRTGFPGQRFLASFFLGPYAAFLLSCDLSPEAGDGGDCDDSERTMWFSPRSTDYGIMGGVGLDFALGEGSVFVDARYSVGLPSVHSTDNGFDASHAGLTFTAGFAVPLGR